MSVYVVDLQGAKRLPCVCDRNTQKRSASKPISVSVNPDGSAIGYCHRCDATIIDRASARARQPGRQRDSRPASRPINRMVPPMQTQRHEVLSTYARAIWGTTMPVRQDDVAGQYLQARRCQLPPRGSHLRWLPRHRHPSGYTGPALVGLLTDVVNRTPLSLHYTWVQGDGTKAAVMPPRLLQAGHRKAGAVCRLWPDEAVTTGLAVAEGIETALSLAHGYTPVWACIDAGNLAALPVLGGIETLVIARDRDPAGEKAALACGQRWAAAGREVLLTAQTTNDLNDLVQDVAA